jgi:hypothetical protein
MRKALRTQLISNDLMPTNKNKPKQDLGGKPVISGAKKDEEQKNMPHTNLMPTINALMSSILEKRHEEMDMEKIEPFSDECKFGKNGVWLFIGPQGSGKTYKLMQTILFTDMMDPNKPFFNNIIFCSTSDELDKTVDSFKKHIKTKIQYIAYGDIFKRLEEHIKHKKKFYAIIKWLRSNGQENDKVMKRLALKHKLYTHDKTAFYIRHKIERYGNPNYPAYCLLILDDFLGSDLLENKMSPMVKMLTKCRHYNITCIIAQQSTKGIGRTVRRLSSDCCLYRGFGETDFLDLVKEFSVSMDKKALYEIYKSLKGRHDCMLFHNHLDEVEIELN